LQQVYPYILYIYIAAKPYIFMDMHLKKFFIVTLCLISFQFAWAQDPTPPAEPEQDEQIIITELERQVADSLYIAETENRPGKPKLLHAEPLYIDLIRDLGARKGEREWNFAGGFTDRLNNDRYEALVEYEWAPIDRLGFEIEVPFTIYSRSHNGTAIGERPPSDRVESLKAATQWTFMVNERFKTSLALGYIHELEFVDLNRMDRRNVFKGNLYNPFFVAAKRWGMNWHTLIYTGPRIEQDFRTRHWEGSYEWHTNLHYMITGTRNFIGLEVNKIAEHGHLDVVMRPQMRLEITETLMLGIVVSIPVSRENERLGTFFRVIYEPKHKGSARH
jgi:hypothetical protein